MKNKRFITKDLLEEAYRNKEESSFEKEVSLKTRETRKLGELPDEFFQIIGSLVSFIETTEELEEKNENK